MGLFGLAFGAGLAVAAKKFAVEVDPRITQIEEILPSANCGACGFPGCSGFAKAVVAGDAAVTACTPGGADCSAKIAGILGTEAGVAVKTVAVCTCGGGDKAALAFKYDGVQDCRSAAAVAGGPKACPFGCLGLGSCANVCPFDAIKMESGLPVVDFEKCTACGVCVTECPRDLMQIVPDKKKVHVACESPWKGKDIKSVCTVGCIGCMICVKNCPANAINFDNNLAKINYDKCINCGVCIVKCPTNAIHDRWTGKALPEPHDPAKAEKILAKLAEKKKKALEAKAAAKADDKPANDKT